MAEKKKKKRHQCRACGCKKAVIRKYGLILCRRCFKEKAERLGFKKFD